MTNENNEATPKYEPAGIVHAGELRIPKASIDPNTGELLDPELQGMLLALYAPDTVPKDWK